MSGTFMICCTGATNKSVSCSFLQRGSLLHHFNTSEIENNAQFSNLCLVLKLGYWRQDRILVEGPVLVTTWINWKMHKHLVQDKTPSIKLNSYMSAGSCQLLRDVSNNVIKEENKW
jgi:hypothetical protein